MPPEFFTTISNWGFPALLVFYMVWRFDQTILPAMVAHLTSVAEMVEAVKTNSSDLKDTHSAAKEAAAAAGRTEVAVKELTTVVKDGFAIRVKES